MAVKKEMRVEIKHNAVDMLISLIVDELSEDLQMDPDEVLSMFIVSKTGQLLYDEDADLWWSGPSDIAELFKEELKKSGTPV